MQKSVKSLASLAVLSLAVAAAPLAEAQRMGTNPPPPVADGSSAVLQAVQLVILSYFGV